MNKGSENRRLITDYLIVWFIAFVGAIMAYWLNHNKVTFHFILLRGY